MAIFPGFNRDFGVGYNPALHMYPESISSLRVSCVMMSSLRLAQVARTGLESRKLGLVWGHP